MFPEDYWISGEPLAFLSTVRGAKTEGIPRTPQHPSKESPDFEPTETVTQWPRETETPMVPNATWHSVTYWTHTHYRPSSDRSRRSVKTSTDFRQHHLPTRTSPTNKETYKSTLSVLDLWTSDTFVNRSFRLWGTRLTTPRGWSESPYRSITPCDTFVTYRNRVYIEKNLPWVVSHIYTLGTKIF